ncbi:MULTISPECIES: SGNH/GDSL hydrolase family protein [Nitrobacteraceae]|uniref:SGNH/GDSL hydrolase family protein n=1 Tax=Afipia birgiae TaxID=151414 RepID=UPI00058C5F93|nr:SGNH/GDSL hydrolase family protein [Afipia birgiae]
MHFSMRSAGVAAMLFGSLAAYPALAQTRPPDAPAQKKGLATKAIEAAKSAASAAGDILTRVPCLPAKGLKEIPGSLPRVARRIAADEPVTIVAFGSSTTVGFGTSSPAYTYPNRLADQLRRKFPTSDITIINRGMGGQDAPEMMKRFDAAVLDTDPDLVIWQFGTNTVVKGSASDIAATAALVEDGIARLQARGIDVVLIDPQYVPAVAARTENAGRMVKLIGDVARLKNVSVFPRFEVMRQWHEDEKMPFDKFVIGDGLHMNDWGYACFAQLLGDTIIKSVGQVKAGVNIPGNVMTYRPM